MTSGEEEGTFASCTRPGNRGPLHNMKIVTSNMPDTLDRPDVVLDSGTTMPHCEVVRRLRFLSDGERQVIVLRRGLSGRPRSVTETAALLRLTPEQVVFLDATACGKLRHPSTGPIAHTYANTPTYARAS